MLLVSVYIVVVLLVSLVSMIVLVFIGMVVVVLLLIRVGNVVLLVVCVCVLVFSRLCSRVGCWLCVVSECGVLFGLVFYVDGVGFIMKLRVVFLVIILCGI